jgi:hypothetical protein
MRVYSREELVAGLVVVEALRAEKADISRRD